MKIITLICCCSSFVFAQPSLPLGWRFPNEKDITSDWKDFQKVYPKPYFISADFTNDGFIDEAWILFKTDSSTWGLFVFLKKENQSLTFPLYIDSSDQIAQSMGISVIEPGEYKTACGKGYWDCKDDEPPIFTLKYPAIDFFKYESANSVFYWDTQLNAFKRIWMSD